MPAQKTDKKLATELPKNFDFLGREQAIYQRWEEGGFFSPHLKPESPIFSIILPPPNITAALHLGSASMLTIEDVMVRYHRLKGDETLWIPGTDHAALPTNYVVEKTLLREEGKNRRDIGREAFLGRIYDFVENTKATIKVQMRRMGASLDWSRERYTLDPGVSRAVRMIFKMMYDDGLIYRGNRIINWCTGCQSTLADDEVKYKTAQEKLYWIKYGPFVLATARPETKLGDTAVAVHPDDPRYQSYVGQTVTIPGVLGPFEVKVVADQAVDREFGSGVIKVTPAHDFTDFEIAERHHLPVKQVIGEDGRMMANTAKYAGLTVLECREQIVTDMQAQGLIEKIADYEHNLSTCDRCGTVIEPLPKLQWFVDVNKKFTLQNNTLGKWQAGEQASLKELMSYAVRSQQITIIPDRFVKTYFHWIDNLRDWCISRQIWFGHQVPAWYRSKAGQPGADKEIYVGIEPPDGADWVQDEDTLDTWFSSGLWTFSTLLKQDSKAADLKTWISESPDFWRYHPTTVLETGYDIIFNWVARMVLMTTYAIGDIPFRTVYLHGLIRDAQGRKMSKSLGNGIDPVSVSEKYGTDAVRLSLIIGITPGNDARLSEEKIASYRNFVTKLWNISRFILSTTQDSQPEPAQLTLADKWILGEFEDLKRQVTDHIENYRFSLAGEALYEFTWNKFADWYLEIAKIEGNKDALLRTILNDLLILWHPFAPFVTEELWGLMHRPEAQPLMVASWPAINSDQTDPQSKEQFSFLQEIITSIRDKKHELKAAKDFAVAIAASAQKNLLEEQRAIIEKLAKTAIDFSADQVNNIVTWVIQGVQLSTNQTNSQNAAKNDQQIATEKAELETYVTNLTERLGNQEFRSRAPAAIITKEEERLKNAKERLASL